MYRDNSCKYLRDFLKTCIIYCKNLQDEGISKLKKQATTKKNSDNLENEAMYSVGNINAIDK
jgi:hypothetical protein